MKITIITVCFNSIATIRESVESVLDQDYSNIEYIVVDGQSTDGAVEVLRESLDRLDVFVSEPDLGIYDAINKGLRLATGDVIGILNSDDVYTSATEISNVAEEFSRHSGHDVIFGDVSFKNFDTNRIIRHYSGQKFRPYKLRFGWMPPHPASFVRKKIYEKYGEYSTSFKISADYERFVVWLMVNKVPYYYINRTIVYMRLGGASTAGLRSLVILNKEIIAACKINGIHTNWIFLVTKVPFKLLEFVIK